MHYAISPPLREVKVLHSAKYDLNSTTISVSEPTHENEKRKAIPWRSSLRVEMRVLQRRR